MSCLSKVKVCRVQLLEGMLNAYYIHHKTLTRRVQITAVHIPAAIADWRRPKRVGDKGNTARPFRILPDHLQLLGRLACLKRPEVLGGRLRPANRHICALFPLSFQQTAGPVAPGKPSMPGAPFGPGSPRSPRSPCNVLRCLLVRRAIPVKQAQQF